MMRGIKMQKIETMMQCGDAMTFGGLLGMIAGCVRHSDLYWDVCKYKMTLHPILELQASGQLFYKSLDEIMAGVAVGAAIFI